jgi:hypothetical protein
MLLNNFDVQMVQESTAVGSDILDAVPACHIVHNLGINRVVYCSF